MPRRFHQVDVFGSDRFRGNPLAVVVDSDGLDTERMQEIARWTNLSETTFLVEPSAEGADYLVRIFTLTGELPFAGHPTLGTAWVWKTVSGTPRDRPVVQECGAGLVNVRPDGDGLAFAAPPVIRSGPVDDSDVERVATVLGLERSAIRAAEWVDNGPGWMALMLEDAESVLAVEGDVARDPGSGSLEIGLVGFHPPGSETAYEIRALFSDASGGLREDPVTGSLNASVAQWLLSSGRVTAPYVATQGSALGRDGRIRISEADGQVWVGGSVHPVIEGTISI